MFFLFKLLILTLLLGLAVVVLGVDYFIKHSLVKVNARDNWVQLREWFKRSPDEVTKIYLMVCVPILVVLLVGYVLL